MQNFAKHACENGKVRHEKNNKTMECFPKGKWENGKYVKIWGNCTLSMKCFSKRKCECDQIDDYEIVTMVRMLVRSKSTYNHGRLSKHENVTMVRMLKWEVKVHKTMEDSLNMKMW